jgi:hypothetical protein
VSYANGTIPIPGTAPEKWHRDRRIHFEIGWLVELTRTIAKNADTEYPEGKAAHPKPWWLDDGLPDEVERALAAVLRFLKDRPSGATAKETGASLKVGKKVTRSRPEARREGQEDRRANHVHAGVAAAPVGSKIAGCFGEEHIGAPRPRAPIVATPPF